MKTLLRSAFLLWSCSAVMPLFLLGGRPLAHRFLVHYRHHVNVARSYDINLRKEDSPDENEARYFLSA
jgi:hypothetical protein